MPWYMIYPMITKLYDHLRSSVRTVGGTKLHIIIPVLFATSLLLVACSSGPNGNARVNPKADPVGDYIHSSKLPWHIAALTSGVLFYRSKAYGKLKRKVVAGLKAK